MSEEQGDAAAEPAAGEEPAGGPDAESETGTEAEPEADDGAETDERSTAPVGDIADRIAEEPAEAVAEEIATLREEVAALTAERDDLESRLKRKQAEFQNYKKRQEKRREEIRARATEALVEDLLEVRDNLSRALEQDEDADIREGVEATFRGLDSILEAEGVEPIAPDPGAETDPKRHEVLLRVESDQPGGTVADLHRPGYEMAGKVLRAAQVTVSEGPAADDSAKSASGEGNAGDPDAENRDE